MSRYPGNTVAIPGGGSVPVPTFITQADIETVHAQFRGEADDVFVVTYPRSGTTWTEQIVHLLLRGGEQGSERLTDAAPWLETLPSRPGGVAFADALPRPRLFTSHLPRSLWPDAAHGRIVAVARNPKDVATSMYFHDQSKQGYDGSADEHVELFIAGRVHYGSYFDHVVPWYEAGAASDRILFLCYEDMQADLAREVRRVAEFVGVAADDDLIRRVVDQSHFDVMSRNANTNFTWVPQREGVPSHYRSGTVGDWRAHLSPEQAARIDALCRERLDPAGLSFLWTR